MDDVIAVLDDLQISQTHYLGYSMGGMIGFGLAKHYPQRMKSIIAGGASPYNRDEPNARDELLEMYEVAAERGNEALIAQIKAWAGSITPEYEARLRSADIQAGLAFLRWRHDHRPDYGADLPALTLPFLLYMGEADEPAEVQEAAAELPNAEFIELRGLNHVGAAGASQIMMPHIKRFLGVIA